MRTYNEIFQELVAHPDFIAGEIIDKDYVIQELSEYINDATGYNLFSVHINDLCEEWFEEHRISMKKNFNHYFEMGEKYHYLRWSSDIITWLENKGIKTIPS